MAQFRANYNYYYFHTLILIMDHVSNTKPSNSSQRRVDLV